jgi:O-antigen/teichoic acid export membrane protein
MSWTIAAIRSAAGARRLIPAPIAALGRKYLLSLGGEGLQSGFHFILNLTLIRTLPAYDYGVFAIVFVLGGIALTYCNALVSIPAGVHLPRLKSFRAVDFQDVVFGSVALAVCAAMAVMAAAGLALTIGVSGEALAGGALVGLWALRNHVRSSLFARRAMAAAALCDLSYVAAGAVLVAAFIGLGGGLPQATGVLAMMAAAHLIAMAVALARRRRPPRVSLRRSVRRRYAAIWPEITWSLVWVTSWNVQGQGLMFLVAAVAGPAAYAPVAAGVVLFGPLRTAVGALVNVLRPEFAAGLAAGHLRQVRLTLWMTSALILLAALVFGGGIRLTWGLLAAHVYGETFAEAGMPLVVTLAFVLALVSLCYHVPLALVQAAREFRAVAIATTTGGALGIALVAVILSQASVAWSLAGATAGEVASLVCLWFAALRVLRQARASPPTPLAATSGLPM